MAQQRATEQITAATAASATSYVRTAAYQPAPSVPQPPDASLPPLPSESLQDPAANTKPSLPDVFDVPTGPRSGQPVPPSEDPLSEAEPAPQPLELPPPSDQPSPNNRSSVPSPFPAGNDQAMPLEPYSPSDASGRSRQRGQVSCDELRERVKSNTIFNVSLDVSPAYGEGLRSVGKDTEQERLAFASRSEMRVWRDVAGEEIAAGRLIDLRDDHVILDADGRTQRIPIWELSDADVAYVGQAWHIPMRCGRGYEVYADRNFIPSVVQWKAPGHSHKPLYFEQPHLERYGHTLGPVLQPMVSTAHFFTNIAFLPYKMGIHPPYECQYPLGHYRPGDCVPYSIRPFPWSLRGAVAETAVVLGGGALIP